MFYATLAALIAAGVELPKRHKTAINLFYAYLVEAGKLTREYHRDLMRAYQLRQRGDYELYAHLGEDQVRQMVEKAEAFIEEIKKVLEA